MVNAEATLALSLELDCTALWLTGRVGGARLSAARLVAGAVVGTLPTLIVLWRHSLYAIPLGAEALWPLAMVGLAFGRQPWRRWLKLCALLYGVTVGLAGVATLALSWSGPLLGGLPPAAVLAAAAPSAAWLVGRRFPLTPARWPWWGLVPLMLSLDGRAVQLSMFWDTGNRLRDPVLRRPVIVASMRAVWAWLPAPALAWCAAVLEGRPLAVPEGFGGRLGTVTYETATGKGVMPVVALDWARVYLGGRWRPLVPVVLGIVGAGARLAEGADALASPAVLGWTAKEEVGA